MLRMANAASQQAVEVGKDRLREFLEAPPSSSSSSSSSAGARRPRKQAMPMPAGGKDVMSDEIEMDNLGDSSNNNKKNLDEI